MGAHFFECPETLCFLKCLFREFRCDTTIHTFMRIIFRVHYVVQPWNAHSARVRGPICRESTAFGEGAQGQGEKPIHLTIPRFQRYSE